jgi:hypothetical protein
MIFNHHRFQIWNQNQHPFVHSMSDFGYANPNLPGITNMQGALDYLVAVIYPNAKPAVATPADLPLTGNTIGDYRVVNDDGDGRSAGYRWEQREGEAEPSWHKIYDVDWSTDSILSAWQNQTLAFYVQKIGYDEADETGTPITGLYAGQRIYGGASANTNLTLSANSGDGAGPQTGFVQVTDHFRPATDNELSLGTTDKRWMSVWATEFKAGTMTLSGGSLTDSSGSVSMGMTSLNTQGSLTVGNTTITGLGSILEASGQIDFDTADLRTLGDIYADKLFLTSSLNLPSGSKIANFTFTNGNINCDSPNVSLNALNITTTGAIYASDIILMNNLNIYDNNILTTVTNSSLNISANGTGSVYIGSTLITGYQVSVVDAPLIVSGATGYLQSGGLRMQGVVLSSVTSGTNIVLQPNNGIVSVSSNVVASTDAARDLGASALRWRDLFVSQAIKDGTNTFTVPDLMKLKDANYRTADRSQAAQVGDALFWDGTQWLASAPDTEITHSSLGGLVAGDAGHTQFVMLEGRLGAQTIHGGVSAGGNLFLDSTSNATKGFINAASPLRPSTDASYSTQWDGLDLGGPVRRWKDIYSAGEHRGLRFENVDTLPSSSSTTPGKAYYLITDQNLYIDTGLAIKQVGGFRVYYDTSWNGTDTLKDVTVSGADARFAIWQLKDNSNDFECMYVSIKATSATNVRITVGSPLPAGTYRLVGV